jgi:hypothetical protein
MGLNTSDGSPRDTEGIGDHASDRRTSPSLTVFYQLRRIQKGPAAVVRRGDYDTRLTTTTNVSVDGVQLCTHAGSTSLPVFDRFGSVHAARLKQQGRRFPLFIFEILTSTRRLRVSRFWVALT